MKNDNIEVVYNMHGINVNVHVDKALAYDEITALKEAARMLTREVLYREATISSSDYRNIAGY